MKRTMTLTLSIEVEDLPDSELKEIAIEQLGCDSVEEAGLGSVATYSAREIAANMVDAMNNTDWQAEGVWAGSEMFAKFGKIEFTKVEWN